MNFDVVPVNYIALVFVYFLTEYLIAVRHRQQSLLIWTVLILIQGVSLYVLREKILIALAFNILLIILVNLFTGRSSALKDDFSEEGFTDDDIIPIGFFSENASDTDVLQQDDETTIYIRNLIAEGKTDDAESYLRMLICYSDQPAQVEQAKAMLLELRSN